MGLSKQQLRKLEKRLGAKNKKLEKEKEAEQQAALKQAQGDKAGKGKGRVKE
jgi:hypothetical protein